MSAFKKRKININDMNININIKYIIIIIHKYKKYNFKAALHGLFNLSGNMTPQIS